MVWWTIAGVGLLYGTYYSIDHRLRKDNTQPNNTKQILANNLKKLAVLLLRLFAFVVGLFVIAFYNFADIKELLYRVFSADNQEYVRNLIEIAFSTRSVTQAVGFTGSVATALFGTASVFVGVTFGNLIVKLATKHKHGTVNNYNNNTKTNIQSHYSFTKLFVLKQQFLN